MGSLSCWCIVCSMCIIFSLCMVVNSLPPPHQLDHLSRDELIRIYFQDGFSNQLILCFLVLQCGIIYTGISLSTLKRVLRRRNLKRRGSYSSLGHVGNCLLVRTGFFRCCCAKRTTLCLCLNNNYVLLDGAK